MIRPKIGVTLLSVAMALAAAGCQTTTVRSAPTTPMESSDLASALPEPLPSPEVQTFTGTGSAADRHASADEAVAANASTCRRQGCTTSRGRS